MPDHQDRPRRDPRDGDGDGRIGDGTPRERAVAAGLPVAAQAPPAVTLRGATDAAAARKAVYAKALAAAASIRPATNERHTLAIVDPAYEGAADFSPADEKRAILEGSTLGRRLRATWRLTDTATGEALGERRTTLATIPHMTDRGTFINKGTDYSLALQLRLRPGVYARRKASGEVESHVNVAPGTGISHRLELEPATGRFRLNIAQSHMPLTPLLRALGVTSEQMRAAWGNDVAVANFLKDDPSVVDKLHARLIRARPGSPPPDAESRRAAVAAAFRAMPLDAAVTSRTLGRPAVAADGPTLLAATAKLLAIHRGEARPDDRDHLAYMTAHPPEDLLAERLGRDRMLMGRLLWKSSRLRSVDHIPAGAMTKSVQSAILGSGLGQPTEAVGAAMLLDQRGRVSRLGVGGIPSTDSIPEESRSVQPSQLGFVDYVVTPESLAAGVDGRLASGAAIGSDGQLYARFRDARTGQSHWMTPGQLADKVVALPGELASGAPHVSAIVDSRTVTAARRDVDYELADMEAALSPLTNMVPMKGGAPPHRSSMSGRFMAQSLPLRDPEAPLVRSGVATGGSYESAYGAALGAPRAGGAGRVAKATADEIVIRRDDGTLERHSLHQHLPFNRKTEFHQTPAVAAGTRVAAGALLATSNYTDAAGVAALGKNARVAYLPTGDNFEDAVVVSRSFADRMRSEHTYQHELEHGANGVKAGRDIHAAVFPGGVDHGRLRDYDERGVARPGTVLHFGDPIILAVKERQRNYNTLHRGRGASYADASITWDHHDDGIVQDVAETPKGLLATVRTSAGLEVGDKLAGRAGDKGVIARILEDADAPRGPDGRPYDVLLNPQGIISRKNPSQVIEAQLGKVAAATGRHYDVKDFGDVDDLRAFAEAELARHGLSDTEEVTDPKTGRRIPGVLTGVRYILKLHHTSECFDDRTEALTDLGWVPWPEVTAAHKLATVEDGRLIYENPIRVVKLPSPGELHCFQGRYVDYAVTGDHRHLVRGPSKAAEWHMQDAASLHGRRFCVSQFGFAGGDSPGDSPGDLPCGIKTWGDYAELVAWWATEGYAKVNHRTACVTLYQSETANPDHLARIEALATRLGFPWSRYKSKGVQFGITIANRPLATYLKQFGTHSHNKRLPRLLFEAPLAARKIAFEIMLDGDGHRAETPTGDSHSYTTTSRQLADDFQELSIRVGLGAVVRLNAPRKETHYLQSYHCGVALKRTTAQVDGDRNAAGFSVRPYAGAVYCAEMRTGLLYVRRNGKPMLTGNSKGQGRGTAAYAADGTPAKGGPTGAKRLSLMDVNALLSHGATAVIRDAGLIRGQAQPEYWAQVMAGFDPPSPRTPAVYGKFMAMLSAAGIHPMAKGTKTQLMALTDADVDRLAGERNLANTETVDWRDLQKPVRGGLFDPALTGGTAGNRWSAIPLHEPMPNPVMEDPIRHVLGLTVKGFRDVLAGREALGGKSGPAAIRDALAGMDLKKEVTAARQAVASLRGGARDAAVRRMGYLVAAERMGLHPGGWVLRRMPVLPPAFRPVSLMQGSKLPLVADPNILYRELHEANANLKDLSGRVDDVGEEREAVYDAMKGVVGLGEPIHPKNRERKVKGILRHVFGDSPKFSMVQRKLISTTTDMVGRAVIAPEPDLDMDQAGIPEGRAWDVYRPFTIRRLVRNGMPRLRAARAVEERSPEARRALVAEMDTRPVVINRAPTLHRYSVMAFRPVLIRGDTLKLPTLVYKGMGADNDGDAVQYHVPASDDAAAEALDKMLPSRNLFSVANFRAHQLPTQEYVAGLHAASTSRRQGARPRVMTSEAVVAAHGRGELSLGDPVLIPEDGG